MPKYRVQAHLDIPTFYYVDIDAPSKQEAMTTAKARYADQGLNAFTDEHEGEPWRIVWDGAEELT